MSRIQSYYQDYLDKQPDNDYNVTREELLEYELKKIIQDPAYNEHIERSYAGLFGVDQECVV